MRNTKCTGLVEEPVVVLNFTDGRKDNLRTGVDDDRIFGVNARAVNDKHGIATQEEAELLESWEVYTVKLSRVKTTNVTWPDLP